MSAPHADVNIFHQNSRDINASFIEKQRKIIVDLNAATSSIKLQLQCMQQERDDLVLENSALHAAIEEQRHEQQTQLLSFSLKLLQDEAEMRKSHDELHRMRSEISL
jgi:regulator of replication initiation timing